jgi:LysM repeat protein
LKQHFSKKLHLCSIKPCSMKQFFLSFLSMLVFLSVISAQKGDLIVKSSDKGLYLEHKVAPKESYYAIGRMYNVGPKFLASFNKLDLSKGLQIDQKLRIPLTDTNFAQTGNSGTPIYYKVDDKEGLMTVSKKNNNVLLSNLRTWNDLANDDVKEGKKLIVGFIKGGSLPVVTINNKPRTEEPVTKVDEPVVKSNPVVEEKPVIKEEKPVIKKTEPVVVKEEPKPATEENGYFKSHFEQQVRISPTTKSETVTAGIFKTTSGWQDKKYYLLLDKVQPGTIVKIINPANNKAVYAKVLGEMSGIRQNEGLGIRISNAAAAALLITEDDKFIVKVNY